MHALHLGPLHIANLSHKAVAPKKRPRALLLGGLCEPGGSTPLAQSPELCTAHGWLTADLEDVREHHMEKVEEPCLIFSVQKAQILGSLKKSQAGVVQRLKVLSEFLGDIKKTVGQQPTT